MSVGAGSPSWWHTTATHAQAEPSPPTALPRRVDCAVVGGGVSGLGAAAAIAEAGRSVVLLEQHEPAAGASGRNAGFLLRGAADNYAAACRQWGRERARFVWRWTEDNLRALIDAGGSAAPGFEQRPSCLVAMEDQERQDIEASIVLLREDGFAVERLGPGDDRATDSLWSNGDPLVGLINPGDACCQPVELVRTLRARADALGVRCVSGARVLSLKEGSGGVAVHHEHGVLHAGACVVCTNAAIPTLLPGCLGRIEANRGQMLACAAPGVRLDRCYYLNYGADYVRQLTDGTVLIGGRRSTNEAGERTTRAEAEEPVQSAIEALLERLLGVRVGASARVLHRWAGTMGFTPDHLPLVGAVPGRGSVVVCGGFTGHGMSMGYLCGRHAAAVALGREGVHPAFDPGRFAALDASGGPAGATRPAGSPTR